MQDTNSKNSSASLENEHDSLDKLRLVKKLNSLSPNSITAAVDSAFNILKHKQSLVKNANRNSSDASSSSSVDSTGSNYCKILNKRSTSSNNNNNSDDESKQDTSYNYMFNYDDSQQEDPHKYGRFYTNPNPIPMLNCIKYFESPINQSQLQYDCTAPIARNTPENNEVRLIDYRQIKIASFTVDGKELICLPQAFEMFLKNLVGGLHTVYTKLKRLDIVPIVCNVEQVRVLRGLGAIQPGVNRCKLIAPNEFDILYDDCTNSGSRPGRPPKRHLNPNDSTDSTNNNNNNNQHHHNHHSNTDDSSPISPPPQQTPSSSNSTQQSKLNMSKLDVTKAALSNLNVKLDSQIQPPLMSPYFASKMKFLNEHENEKRSNFHLTSPSSHYNAKNDLADLKKNEHYAAALNCMQKLGLLNQYSNLKPTEANNHSYHHPAFNTFYEQASYNPAMVANLARFFPPHLQTFNSVSNQLDHMPHYLNEYTTRMSGLQNSFYNNQLINHADLNKSCNPVREERNIMHDEQKQASENDHRIAKNYSESLMINSRTSGAKRQEELDSLKSNNNSISNKTNTSKIYEANSDLEELEDEVDYDEEKLNRKSEEYNKLESNYKMDKLDPKSAQLHPLSVEYLTGVASRNDSIDMITNACSSSSSSSSSTMSSLSNNNYGHNMFSSTRSSPVLASSNENNYDKSKFNSAWSFDLAKLNSSSEMYQNNSLLPICSLINVMVRNSVSKLDASFKSDLESLRQSLHAEKLQRVKSDCKIQHLIRLQNVLRNKMRTQRLIADAKIRRTRTSSLRRNLRQNSSRLLASLAASNTHPDVQN